MKLQKLFTSYKTLVIAG